MKREAVKTLLVILQRMDSSSLAVCVANVYCTRSTVTQRYSAHARKVREFSALLDDIDDVRTDLLEGLPHVLKI